MIESLGSKRRHAEAARVLLDYVDDIDEAVSSLVRGGEWSEASSDRESGHMLFVNPHLLAVVFRLHFVNGMTLY